MADSSKKTGAPASRSRQAAKTGESSTKKLLRILVMLICCAGAGYCFWINMQIEEENEYAAEELSRPQPPDPTVEAEKGEIAAAEEGLQNMTASSSQAMRLAQSAETYHRFPLDLPVTLVASPAAAVVGEIVAEPEPPMVTVTAVMITDADKVAIVNVDGEDGIIMRLNSKFADGKARITNIDAKGVTFTWMRKKYQVTL